MATKKEEPVYTYRVRPDAGRYYVGARYNQDGEEEDVVTARHMSEPDAEKELRAIVTGPDVIAGPRLHSVDAEDNTHIVVETSRPDVAKLHGATLKYAPEDGEAEQTPADKALEDGTIADAPGAVEPTEAEQKARDRAAEKARKEEEEAE